MLRILFLLAVMLVSNIRVATAQYAEVVAQTSCDSPVSQQGTEGEPLDETNNNSSQKASLPQEQNDSEKESKSIAMSNGSVYSDKPQGDKPEGAVNPAQEQTVESAVNTKPRIAVAGITAPSLWWAKEQFDPFGGRLIDDWLTYPQVRQIDLTVNWQLWTLLDYLGRYRLINQLGTVTREYGYSLRIFNQQKQCLALYEYNDAVSPPKWEIKLEGLGQDSLQVEPANGEQ